MKIHNVTISLDSWNPNWCRAGYALGTYHEYIHLENAVRKFFENKETASKDEILELLNDLENDI